MTQPPPPPSGPWGPPNPGGTPGPQRGFAKWIIGAVTLVAVIAVTAVVAVSCTKSSGGSDKPTAAPTTSGAPTSDFASANDTGPVSVITEDPSCAPWMPILTTLANSQQNGWDKRDPSIPASVWSPEARDQYRAVGDAFRSAADQAVPLVKLTRHRVIRELLSQFVAYARDYADRVPVYTPPDNHLVLVAVGAGEVLSHICQAINNGSAAARAPLTPPSQPPTTIAPLGDPQAPERFLTASNPMCTEWRQAIEDFNASPALIAWKNTDAALPASQWTPELKAATDAVKPVMMKWADRLEEVGRRSDNPTFEDIATLSAQYLRAYVQSLPTYTNTDENLYDTGRLAPPVVLSACEAVGV